LRTERRSPRPRLLQRSPKANGRKEKARLLHIIRRRSIPALSHPSLHRKREAIQRMGALIPRG